MGDQITSGDFCGLCGSLLNHDEDVTCASCDKEVMGVMANGAKMSRSKGVEQCDSNGKVLKRYPSISAASRRTGITISSISRVCAGVLGSAGGYAWSYS
jgi:hypothetical protein